MDFGDALGREFGITKAKMEELPDWQNSDVYDRAERVALEYADAMITTPCVVSAELRRRLREHYSERQLVELTHAIAIEGFRARFNRGLGVESDHYSR